MFRRFKQFKAIYSIHLSYPIDPIQSLLSHQTSHAHFLSKTTAPQPHSPTASMSNFLSEAKNLASNFEQGGNQQGGDDYGENQQSGGGYGNQDDDQSSDSYGNQSGGGAQTRDQYSNNKQAGGYGDSQQDGYGDNQQQQQQQQGNQSQSGGGMIGGIEKTAEDGFVNQGEWGARRGCEPVARFAVSD